MTVFILDAYSINIYADVLAYTCVCVWEGGLCINGFHTISDLKKRVLSMIIDFSQRYKIIITYIEWQCDQHKSSQNKRNVFWEK